MRSVYYLIFAVSGFAGLIYESIWTHYLKLFLGHAAYAQTLVLAIFMGGMAVGSALCSRYSGRWRSLLRAYAIAEGLIGVCALVFHPLFDGFVNFAYTEIIPQLGTAAHVTFLKWAAGTLLILPQSILLGMTFPLMSAGIIRRFPDRPGATISMLYFTNSIGGALGVLAAGFVMVRLLGLPGTIACAGLINIVLAGVVWWLAGSQPDAGTAAASTDSGRAPAGGPYGLLLAASFLTGLASFVYEIGWIRMLNLVLGSSTHAFELMLSAFLLGLAFGGLWIRRRIDRLTDPVRFLGFVQVVMGACALATLAVYNPTFDAMQWLLHAIPKTDAGYTWFNAGSHAIALAVMLPATFCAGMTLPLITYTLMRGGHGEASIGAVYAANTVGAIVGVFVAVHFGMPLLGLKGLIAFGSAIDMALGVVLIRWAARGTNWRLPVLATAASVGALAVTLALVQLDPYRMASGVYRVGNILNTVRADVVEHRDGKTATVHLTRERDGKILVLRTNGKADASVATAGGPLQADELTMVLTGALPLLLHPNAKIAANIGFGSGITSHVLLSAGRLEALDTIEIEAAMVEVARAMRPFNTLAYSDPRSRIHIEDAKSFFSAHNQKYDIIVSEPSNPWVSGVAGLFSEEFYRLAARHLADRGILAQWLQLYEINFDLLASVLKAVEGGFSDYVIYAVNHVDILVVARNGGPVPEIDASMFQVPAFAAELARIGVHGPNDLQIRKVATKNLLAPLLRSIPVRPNSDYHPVLDQNAARSRFLNQNAQELLSLTVEPAPVLELLGVRPALSAATPVTPVRYFIASQRAYAAALVHDAIIRGTTDGLNGRVVGESAEVAESIKRAVSGCRASAAGRAQKLEAMLNVAVEVNPYLDPRELEAIWDWVATRPCGSALAPPDAVWFDLFKAVAARDALRIATIGDVLLGQSPPPSRDHLRYLVGVTALAHISSGNKRAARMILERHGSGALGLRQNRLLFRLLAAHSAGS